MCPFFAACFPGDSPSSSSLLEGSPRHIYPQACGTCAPKCLSAQVRKELEVNGIEFYPQKEFDEDLEDKTENDKIRVGYVLLREGKGGMRAGQI